MNATSNQATSGFLSASEPFDLVLLAPGIIDWDVKEGFPLATVKDCLYGTFQRLGSLSRARSTNYHDNAKVDISAWMPKMPKAKHESVSSCGCL